MEAWQEQRRAHHSVALEVGYRLIRSLVICWLRMRISAEKYTEKKPSEAVTPTQTTWFQTRSKYQISIRTHRRLQPNLDQILFDLQT